MLNLFRLLALAIAFGVAGSAAAQTNATDPTSDVRREARGHFGPFYLTPTVLFKDVGVDNNVFNTAGDQKSDFTMTVAPRLDVWVPIARRALLKTTVAPDLVWFATYESERSVNPQAEARGEVYLNRVTLFAERAYRNTRERSNYEIDWRSRHVEDTVRGGVAIALTPKFSVEAAVRKNDLRYEDSDVDGVSLQRPLNRDTRGTQFSGRFRATPLTTLVVRYDTAQDRFEFSPSRNSNSYRVMPGVEFAPQALIRGMAYVGYRKFTPLFPDALPEFAGIVGELGLSYTLLGSTTFGASYRRDLTYSYSELQPFFVDNSIGASIRRALGSRFDVLVSADRHRYDYYASLQGTVSDSIPRIDTTWHYGGSLGFRVGRDGRIGFGVDYVQRESTVGFRTYDNLRFVSNITYGF